MTNQDSGSTPSDATKTAEETEAGAAHRADRPPTAEEDKAAPKSASAETAKDYKEMADLGANVEGEGELP
jgi:hypothetical protein